MSREAAPRVSTRSRRETISATKTEVAEHPIWTALAILCFIALLWGALISWDITAGAKPEDSLLTKMWSSK